MALRVLLVESEAEDVLFLREVLAEIEAGRYWSHWVHIEALQARTWAEASAILASETVDVILLDLDLADCRDIETFRWIHAAAERVPVILLTAPEDDALAVRSVRDGAQDFLLKKQVDCTPLAHAVRNAIERHRLLAAARAASTIDPLTGLSNRAGFASMAERDRKLAERLGRRLTILVAEPKNLAELADSFGQQRRDLALVEAADRLRTMAGPTDVLARIGECRFAMAIFETELESLEEAWSRISAAAQAHRMAIGAATFDPSRPATLETLLDLAGLELGGGEPASQAFAVGQ